MATIFDDISRKMAAPLIGWGITERIGLTYNTEILLGPQPERSGLLG